MRRCRKTAGESCICILRAKCAQCVQAVQALQVKVVAAYKALHGPPIAAASKVSCALLVNQIMPEKAIVMSCLSIQFCLVFVF